VRASEIPGDTLCAVVLVLRVFVVSGFRGTEASESAENRVFRYFLLFFTVFCQFLLFFTVFRLFFAVFRENRYFP